LNANKFLKVKLNTLVSEEDRVEGIVTMEKAGKTEIRGGALADLLQLLYKQDQLQGINYN
jgi:hypothetical protein